MVAYGMLAIILMVVDHRADLLTPVRSTLSLAIWPVQMAVDLPVRAGRWVSGQLASHDALEQQNQQLYDDLLKARMNLHKLESLVAENERLRILLNAAANQPGEVRAAELINVDLDPFRHRILINRGSRHGVFPGQPLVDANGVMGQVTLVSPMTAEVMLVSDPDHALPIQFNRTGLRSIAFGTGRTGELQLPHIPISADVLGGDLLVTSGLGGHFPPGIPVAVIERVTRTPGETFAVANATPVAALDRSREVLLLWPQSSPDDSADDANQDNPDAGTTIGESSDVLQQSEAPQ